MIMLYW